MYLLWDLLDEWRSRFYLPFHMRRLHCGVHHCMPNSITSIQGRGFFRDSGFGLVLSAAAACATWRLEGTERLEHNRRCSVAGCAEFPKRIGQARLGSESSGSAFHAAAPLLNKAPEFHLKPPAHNFNLHIAACRLPAPADRQALLP